MEGVVYQHLSGHGPRGLTREVTDTARVGRETCEQDQKSTSRGDFMMTESTTTPSNRTPTYRLTTSAYDQAASGLLSALLFVGVIVACLLILFFSSRIFARQKPLPVTIAEVGGREEGSALGTARDLEEPGAEDVPDLVEETSMQTLETITSAVASKTAQLDDMTLDSEFVTGAGKGKGDNRQVGSGTASEQVPRAQRWAIHFDGGNLKEYARQLDFFGIELAAVGGEDNLVHYAFNLAKPKPDHRTGAPDAEQRLYMTWRAGPLQAADRELLTKAGINLQGKVVMQFYPAATEQMLAKLERTYAGDKDINEIRRTTFDIRSGGDKYEFVVTAQQTF